MAHYAFINDQNIVFQVIMGKDEGEGTDWEMEYGSVLNHRCLRTSFNTKHGVHYDADGNPSADQSKAFRKNFAGPEYVYIEPPVDGFAPPKPFPSWVLDEAICDWVAPVAKPDDGKLYVWDEDVQNWVEVQPNLNL
jgi:hypothetical protein